MSTTLLIWSKDRACQLHLLLESLQKHLPGLFNTTVLYTTSSDKFEKGYQRVQSEFRSVKWITERDFHVDTLSIIENSKCDNLCFSTDDTIIYRKPPISPLTFLSAGEVFSFRLGLNTILQNPHNGMTQPPLSSCLLKNGILSWSAYHYDSIMNYGYPFSLDMHMFNRDFILALIQNMPFKNTSELEGNLFYCRRNCPNMYSFEHSVAFNVPLNKLSKTLYNGESTRVTMSDLNDSYLAGRRINLEPIEQLKIIGAHQFIDLEFIDG
jgi:hypothetical protein